MIKIEERTFEALKYPKNSPEREKLNEECATSEFLPDEKYTLVLGNQEVMSFKSLKDAVNYLKDALDGN